jgi:signal transduction histidine kinase
VVEQTPVGKEERPSLLIVDDEKGPAESLRIIFKPTYNVYTATGGAQALDIVRSTPIDVVTLDLRMPGMLGTEVMEHIKRLDPDIEVIVITGYASLDSAVQGLRHRIFDYITKPFDVAQVSDLVGRAVARRRAALRARHIQEDFLANLSHELRTPLSAIIGYNIILTEELYASLTSDQRVAFDRVQANSQELLNLIETVLLLNSLDAGELTHAPARFDVFGMLRRTVRHFAAAARQRGLQLSVQGGAPLEIVSDEQKLERVLWALVDNAIKFTAEGRIVLSARPSPDEKTVDIDVQDTGIGMDEQESARILNGLHTSAAEQRPYRGLGLGLRMATRLTEFLGGRLSFSSVPGSGTRFTITLPSEAAGFGGGQAYHA